MNWRHNELYTLYSACHIVPHGSTFKCTDQIIISVGEEADKAGLKCHCQEIAMPVRKLATQQHQVQHSCDSDA